MNFKRFFDRNANGKGYYIALALCAVAIGATGYMYFRNAGKTTKAEDVIPVETWQDVAAIGTVPKPADVPTTRPEPTAETKKEPMKTVAPVEGQTVAVYAMDYLDYNETTRDWRVHNGVDIAAEVGTSVCAAADGVVYTVVEDDAMGMTVVIRHDDGYVTRYSSLDKDVQVVNGEKVTVGQIIGYVGETALLETAEGAHVHFSVTKDGEAMDPAEFCSIAQ